MENSNRVLMNLVLMQEVKDKLVKIIPAIENFLVESSAEGNIYLKPINKETKETPTNSKIVLHPVGKSVVVTLDNFSNIVLKDNRNSLRIEQIKILSKILKHEDEVCEVVEYYINKVKV